jgi:hypothetical protein
VRGGNRLSEEYQVKLNHVAVLGRTQTYVALLIYIFPLSGLLFKSPSSLSSLVDSFTGPILLQIAPAYQASLRYPLTSRSIKFSSELQAIFHLSRSTLTRDEPRSVAPRSRWRDAERICGSPSISMGGETFEPSLTSDCPTTKFVINHFKLLCPFFALRLNCNFFVPR